MTSLTFIGQSYAAPELSSTPERVLWRPKKFRHHANARHNHEGKKAREDVPHGSGVGPVVGMEIGLNREVNRQENDREAQPNQAK